jgi:hypothetical protein
MLNAFGSSPPTPKLSDKDHDALLEAPVCLDRDGSTATAC